MGRTEAHAGLKPPVNPKPRAKRRNRRNARSGNLVIVESPAKARTVGRFLGKDYKVKASVGHIRDLLRSQLSVDVENEFQPKYRVPNEKREVAKELRSDAARAERVYLATDPDREGEAIAWHLMEAAEIEPERANRVVFHEITKEAIERAFRNPRGLDMDLVDAQQARRILDRLVGYNISPLLWAKVRSRLSAGRVQSVALRLIVDREREIERFEPREYWTVDGKFLNASKPPGFRAKLVKIDGADPELPDEAAVQPVLEDLRRANFRVDEVRRGKRTRKPSAPFTTSTLQQSASRRLGFSARKSMSIAQQLYEGIDLGSDDSVGLITYMRTDSTKVSAKAQREARKVIQEQFGANYCPEMPPEYKTKSRSAQEAHEAIRPTAVERTPDAISGFLTEDQRRLYRLIWNRFVASQMKAAVYDTLVIRIVGSSQTHSYQFRLTASSLRFAGFLRAHADQRRENGGEADDEGLDSDMAQLPDLVSGDRVDLLELFPEQHFTQPPARFSDASLVKALEDHGIGRPSTYAPIISTLMKRGYVRRDNRRLKPTEIGLTVNDLVVDHFRDIVDVGFTARMEDELDEIAAGDREWVEVIREFYGPFSEQVARAEEFMPEVKTEPEFLDRTCPECGHRLVLRHGRFGKFIGCSNFPNCRHTEPWLEKIGIACPEDGGELVERRTRKGRVFFGCSNYPECEFTTWKRPFQHPCPACGGLLVHSGNGELTCLQCSSTHQAVAFPESKQETA